MKKLHGTHSIQPLTITDAVVAEDAQIAESKIALTYTTTELNDYASAIDQRLSAHEATSTDPHGQILTQTTIRSEDIQSSPSPVQQTITVTNAGDGNVLLDIDGDIKADNATLDGDVNISGVTSIGGQTHISGSVVIDGDLTVVGTTTKVESETIDYDSLLVTPSSATNHTGIIVAPDGTGFNGDTEEPTEDTFLGNLLELQTRTRGLNEAAVIVDRNGNLNILKGDVTIQGNKLGVTSNGINFTSDITVPSVTTTDKGFIYKTNSSATPGSTVISCKNSSDNNLFTVGGNGNASVGGTLTLGGANDPIYYDGNEYGTQADVAFTNNVVTFDDSILTLAAGNNTPWKIFNAHSSVSFYFGVQNAPKLEISENEVTIAQANTSLQNLTVHGTSSFTGDVTMALDATVDGVDIGIHDHSGVAGHGERIPTTSVIGLQEFLDGHMEIVQDYVGGMVSNNTESGIAVTYDDDSGKLNFDVNDFTITAAGDASGSVTVSDLGNSTFTLTILDSDKVDGLHVTSGTVNNEANKVVKTDANGHTKCGWINTTSGNASTTTMDRVYASYDGYIRYYTPANFATQILALGGTVKNSHVHDKVNSLKPMRGSSTFNGTTGRVVMLPAAFANTNYTVAVTPTANTNGQLGDVWVSKSTDRFTVYNTGTATVAFDYIAIG